jgi:putative transposase
MPNTYSKLYIHFVFAVKYRQRLITEEYRDEVEKFICGVVRRRESKVLAIYCNPDHLHALVSVTPTILISDLVRDVKSSSSAFINQKNWWPGKFQWQEGYGAFSCSYGHVDRVARYILNQAEHHKGHSFRQEYLNLLKENDIAYEEKYLFEWHEQVA